VRKFKNKDLAEILGTKLASLRRLSNCFLGADDAAPLQGGKARVFTKAEVERVFIGHFLKYRCRYTFGEAVKIVDIIEAGRSKLDNADAIRIFDSSRDGTDKTFFIEADVDGKTVMVNPLPTSEWGPPSFPMHDRIHFETIDWRQLQKMFDERIANLDRPKPE
jgi:hypothetical protein